ncbi:(2Fe-2S)-binding protein [Streptomyces sp. CBMA29]|uniref:(2Fe-2S)-binding protein n=1 Tax=Streptomyces sp. CBMA29 TaxID=1896314 RepID=UPI0016620306|nr:(2Fe-2S)-binding protein [Streptomyces sp. CBMA29]MBD0736723.1 hypothetical protein [Streptomyces sp. CBMA29]
MTVRITLDGRDLDAPEGAVLTTALLGAGQARLGDHAVTGEPRGAWCGMGVCFECEVTVDGDRSVRACLTLVLPGMAVTTGTGTVTADACGTEASATRGAP